MVRVGFILGVAALSAGFMVIKTRPGDGQTAEETKRDKTIWGTAGFVLGLIFAYFVDLPG